MSTVIWRGGIAANIRQIATLVIGGTWSTNDTITLTISNVSLVFTVGSTTSTTGIASALKSWFGGTDPADGSSFTISASDSGAQGVPQFAEITATVSSSTVTLTANQSNALAGKPFTLSRSLSSASGTATLTLNATAPAGQYHADSASNWSGNAGPEDSDTLIFDTGTFDMRWGLTTYASGPSTSNPTTITKYKAFSGNVGLAYINTDSSGKSYPEYRTRYFTTDAGATANCTANLEVGDGPGSGLFLWDAGSGQTTVYVYGKGSPLVAGIPCICLKGSHASNSISNLAGDVGLAFFGGETATYATVITGDGPASQASTKCGSGCTLTTVTLNGGYQQTNSAITTAKQYAGTWDHYSGTITTLTVFGGTFIVRSACTITTGTVYGKIDLSHCAGTVTFTNLVNLYGAAEIYDPNGRATFSAGYKLNSVTAKVTRPAGDTHSLS